MDDNLTPHLSPRSIRIMTLFKQHGHDMNQFLAAHPEITPDEVIQVTMEVMTAMKAVGAIPPDLKPAKRTQRNIRNPADAYQLKITLRGSKPPIWRRIAVPGDLTLALLHEVIQTAMGWHNEHLHSFEINGISYGGIAPDGYKLENDDLDESKYRLCDVVHDEKTKFRYEYDFGDDWEHILVLEKILPASEKPKTMICLAGKGNCPPEDCGGIWGYYQMLAIFADPTHEEHKNIKQWMGRSFDPAKFDAAQKTKALSSLPI